MNAQLQMKLIRAGNLLPLSLVNATKRVPQPASNEERARTFRAAMPSPAYNSHPWHTLSPSSSAADTPRCMVAGGLEPDYAAYQEPQDVIPFAERRGA